jgi:glutathione-independent formaldehyde dehydrogenase
VKRYNRQLMQMILNDRAHIADAVNASVIPLDEAPGGYRTFDEGAATKFVLDPHGTVAAAEPTAGGHEPALDRLGT